MTATPEGVDSPTAGGVGDATCPVCQSNRVTITEGSTWRKCRGCEASWNSLYTETREVEK